MKVDINGLLARIGLFILSMIMLAANIVTSMCLGATFYETFKSAPLGYCVVVWTYGCGCVIHYAVSTAARRYLLGPAEEEET